MYECFSWVMEGKAFDQHMIVFIENAYQNVMTDIEWWEENTVVPGKTGVI